jgi:serine/threonine protein kinase
MAFRFVADPMLGRKLGRYHVQGNLGRGNMGAAYRAVPDDGGPPVAVKVLQRDLVDEPELVERFDREITNTASIDHPNIVRYFEHGRTDDGITWLAAELLEGASLADVIERDAPVPEARARALCAQIASGLGAAHAVGVVHRDLKPENVMVLEGDRVKVFDFGLARTSLPSQPALTAADLRVGTPMFMAPEYIADGRLDHRSDLYALGVALFELLTGDTPFEGPPFKVLHQHVTRAPPRVRDRRPEVSEALDDLVDALLAKDPDERPQSASDVADLLR